MSGASGCVGETALNLVRAQTLGISRRTCSGPLPITSADPALRQARCIRSPGMLLSPLLAAGAMAAVQRCLWCPTRWLAPRWLTIASERIYGSLHVGPKTSALSDRSTPETRQSPHSTSAPAWATNGR